MIIDELESLEERTKLELQPFTFQGYIPSTSSATVSSNTVRSDVSPGISQEQSLRLVATSPQLFPLALLLLTLFLLMFYVKLFLLTWNAHTPVDLASPAETSNSKAEYNKSENRCGIMIHYMLPRKYSMNIHSVLLKF